MSVEIRQETKRSVNARALLLDAAEMLFAQRGIDGVSLRQIAASAGQRNVSAVRYHFGDKQGLVDALVADRMAKIDTVRSALVESAGDLSRKTTRELLHLLWQPLLDLDKAKEIHWFIQFHPVGGLRQSPASDYPTGNDGPTGNDASRRIHDALQALHPHLSMTQFHYRLNLIAMMFGSAASWHDSVIQANNQHWSSRFSLDEVVKVAVGALQAPA
jgi:AcrR family transcriptional regulator